MEKKRGKLTPMELYEELTYDRVAELAEQVGVSRAYLYQVLTERRSPSLAAAQRITDACGGRVEFIRRSPVKGA